MKTRKWARREIERAINNLGWAFVHIDRVYEKYKGHDETLDKFFTMFFTFLSYADEALRKMLEVM